MDDNNKDVHDNKNDEYEKYCYLCRRPESQVGKLIYLPNNINICQDCMQPPVKFMLNDCGGHFRTLSNLFEMIFSNSPDNEGTVGITSVEEMLNQTSSEITKNLTK